MQILVTGFEPFHKSSINPSEQIVRRLENQPIPGIELCTAILPVDLLHGPHAVIQAVESFQPDAVLCLGEAGRRARLSIERVAVNLLDFRIPDNAGNQVEDEPVIQNGPAAYFTTLPVRRLFQVIQAVNVPVELSLSAGSYLCNQVLYTLLHHLQTHKLNIPAGFIHLPMLPEQVATLTESIPSMSLETMEKGIRAAMVEIAN